MEQNRSSTRVLVVDSLQPERHLLREAGGVLRDGGLVAFPTETVYGLGANALDAEAVKRIFRAKGRPPDNPLIVHLDSHDALGFYFSEVPAEALELAGRFWPGPLTLVLRGGKKFPRVVTGGLETVAVRVPAHPVAIGLIRQAGVPVAAPSANTSGRPSPTTAAHVLEDMDGRIDLLLDGGPAGLGVESTVLDLSGEKPIILRPGGVTPGELEAVLGPVAIDPSVNGAPGTGKPRSPGMKYTHYAPLAPLILFEGSGGDKVAERLLEEAGKQAALGRRVGVLACKENSPLYQGKGYVVVAAGRRSEPQAVAARLYDCLRQFDKLGVDVILAEGIPAEGLGLAVMNRLRRAAGGNVVHV